MIAALGRRGYEIQGSYVPIHLLHNFSMCVWDRLPRADRIWTDLVELPCEPGMPLEHVKKIATVVKRRSVANRLLKKAHLLRQSV